MLDAEAYLVNLFAGRGSADVYHLCHRPIVVTDPETTIETVLPQLEVDAEHRHDRIIDNDVILFWGSSTRRIITGADILGRLLQGIVRRVEPDQEASEKATDPRPGGTTPGAL